MSLTTTTFRGMNSSPISVLVLGFMLGQACTRKPIFVPNSLRLTLITEQQSLLTYAFRKLIPRRLHKWLLAIASKLPGIDATLAHVIQQYTSDSPSWRSSLVHGATVASSVGLQPSLLTQSHVRRLNRSVSLPAKGLQCLEWTQDVSSSAGLPIPDAPIPTLLVSPPHDSPAPSQVHPEGHVENDDRHVSLPTLQDAIHCGPSSPRVDQRWLLVPLRPESSASPTVTVLNSPLPDILNRLLSIEPASIERPRKPDQLFKSSSQSVGEAEVVVEIPCPDLKLLDRNLSDPVDDKYAVASPERASIIQEHHTEPFGSRVDSPLSGLPSEVFDAQRDSIVDSVAAPYINIIPVDTTSIASSSEENDPPELIVEETRERRLPSPLLELRPLFSPAESASEDEASLAEQDDEHESISTEDPAGRIDDSEEESHLVLGYSVLRA
ncbi:hypothetical protein K474DRAFT_1508683 [Panus rudis PR-1116 ss-1]|nr:hypothetical protein K474DRAFT_1508683 [Panus rudis PR-1116 ss-1]